MMSLFLASLNQSIVNTAIPRIVAEMNGFDTYAWIITAYMLTSTSVIPIVGKLGDLYGRKPFLLGGAAYFVVTTALCGLAPSSSAAVRCGLWLFGRTPRLRRTNADSGLAERSAPG